MCFGRKSTSPLDFNNKTFGEYFIRFTAVHSLTSIFPACVSCWTIANGFPLFRRQYQRQKPRERRHEAHALMTPFHSKSFVYVSLHAFRALSVLVVAMSSPKIFLCFSPKRLSSQRKIDSDGMKNLRSRCRWEFSLIEKSLLGRHPVNYLLDITLSVATAPTRSSSSRISDSFSAISSRKFAVNPRWGIFPQEEKRKEKTNTLIRILCAQESTGYLHSDRSDHRI